MHGLEIGRDEAPYLPPGFKSARREHAADVSSASRIQHILSPGTVLPLWGLCDADSVLGYITVDNDKIDIGGSAFIVGGQTADGCKVALKVFTTPMHDYQVTLIRHELDTVRKLAPHPNILSFLGTCPHQNAVLVSPLMRNGNLLKYLERNPATDRQRLVVQVAEALCHVHDVLKLVHGDLKCENVLISDEGDALLADFGLSTAIEKAASDVTTVSDIRQKSTLRFNAPELMLDQVEQVDEKGRLRVRSKTTATDMYAFGMLILQAFTSERPWPHLTLEMQIITAVCYARRIHPRPDAQSRAVAAGFTDRHWDVCSSCWNFQPHDRPKIRHVLSTLVQSTTREHPTHEFDTTGRTSSRPERNGGTTTEGVANRLRGQLTSSHSHQPGSPSLPPAYSVTQFQSGAIQGACADITRPLYEDMYTQYIVKRGMCIDLSKRIVKGRIVDMFKLHKAHFRAQGIGRQLPDDMWQLIAGELGFGQLPDNLRGTSEVALTIKNLYEHYLRDFDVEVVQKLSELHHWQQQGHQPAESGGGDLPTRVRAAPQQNTLTPGPQPNQPPQMQQGHGDAPLAPFVPQGAVKPQQQRIIMSLQQRLERVVQLESQQMTMPAPAGTPQTQLHQSDAFARRQSTQQQTSLGPPPPPPVNAPSLEAISYQQMTQFAASRNSRPSQIIPIQELGEWRALLEELLTMCKDVDVLLPHAYNIEPDQNVAKMLIVIGLSARDQQQHCIAPFSPTRQRVLIDAKMLQRFMAFVGDWTLKARAQIQSYQQQQRMQTIYSFTISFDSLKSPPASGLYSQETSASNNEDWEWDFAPSPSEGLFPIPLPSPALSRSGES